MRVRDLIADALWDLGKYITIAGIVVVLSGLGDRTCLFTGLGIMFSSLVVIFTVQFIETVKEGLEDLKKG